MTGSVGDSGGNGTPGWGWPGGDLGCERKICTGLWGAFRPGRGLSDSSTLR